MTLPAGLLRREPVALLVGVGILGLLVLGLLVSGVRMLYRRESVLEFGFERSVIPRNTVADMIVTVHGSYPPRGAVVEAVLESGSRRVPLYTRLGTHAEQGESIRLSLPEIARGLYTVTDVRLVTPDPLGFSTVTTTPTWRSIPLRILPLVRPVPLNEEFPGEGEHRRFPGRSWEREGDRIDARPYVPGDEITRINWNVYAHTGELFVRIPEELPPPSRAVMVVVESGQVSESVLDQVIEAALGVAENLEARDHRVCVWVDGTDALGSSEAARYALAALDHQAGLRDQEVRPTEPAEIGGAGAPLVVTTGRSARCPAELQGDWIVLVPEGGYGGAARRLAPLDGDD